jgi:hypothetical protein
VHADPVVNLSIKTGLQQNSAGMTKQFRYNPPARSQRAALRLAL